MEIQSGISGPGVGKLRGSGNLAYREEMGQQELKTLKNNGGLVLSVFVHPEYLYTFLVCKESIEAFSNEGKKVLEARMHVKWKTAPGTVANENRLPFVHLGGEGHAHVPKAVAAVFMPSRNEVFVAHDDGFLRSYSLRRGQMGAMTNQLQLQYDVVSILVYKDSQLILTGGKGSVVIVQTEERPSVHKVLDEIEVADAKVTCACTYGDMLYVGDDSGYIHPKKLEEETSGATTGLIPFAAHAGAVVGLSLIYSGQYVLSGGVDKCLACIDVQSGRCLRRQNLEFHIAIVQGAQQTPITKWGSHSVLVGGKQGEVFVYTAEILSTWKSVIIEISKVTGGSHNFISSSKLTALGFFAGDRVLSVCKTDGTLRQWLLSAKVSRRLGLNEEEAKEFERIPGTASELIAPVRIGSNSKILELQETLEKTFDDEVGLSDHVKDEVVNSFQRLQEEKQIALRDAESFLEKRKQELLLSHEVQEEETTPKEVRNAQRLCREEEIMRLYFAHHDAVWAATDELRVELKKVLSNGLKSANGNAEAVEELRSRLEAI